MLLKLARITTACVAVAWISPMLGAQSVESLPQRFTAFAVSTGGPFTFIELRLNDNNRGEGKLTLATRIIGNSDGTRLELENYTLQPIDLNNVRPAE
jgi:hypothetical protein